ncbi:MAG: hypothetical protein QOF49_1353 [Chloroflexota bacterium]|jgi:DNA-binding transcriptional ArsR family regulator|nr:hypothetical protein [Chloroflexota bacterium]
MLDANGSSPESAIGAERPLAHAIRRRRTTALTCKRALAYHRGLDVFKALVDPTRRTILDELTERDGQTLFELCSRLLMKHQVRSTRQAISQHLDVLEAAGLIRVERKGRYKFHHLDTTPLRDIAERWPARE